MTKTLLILRYEMAAAFRRRSFLFMAFGLPLIACLVFMGMSLLGGDRPTGSTGSPALPDAHELQREGYVDLSGLIEEIHPDVPRGILTAYPDEDSARQAMHSGEIAAYYLVPSDYVETGNLIYVNPNYRPVSAEGQAWVMRWTLFANLLGNDPERMRAGQPMDVHVTALAPADMRQEVDSPLVFYIPYGMMMLSGMVLMMSAGLLLNSVSVEKQNRTMEILLSSITSRQMLIGKVAALGMLGLLQAAVWFGTAYFLLGAGGRVELPPGLEVPASVVPWGIVFFVLSYAVYASQMAGLGALVPSAREASQSMILVMWPILISFVFSPMLIADPHGALATGLSLFPLTAPFSMMGRLVVGGVPWWQPWLAAALMAITAGFIIRMVARMFRAQTLLAGQPFSARRYVRALFART
ncbi:MAG TPA: ABC transporter permease [Anaerolineae bacterium]|nr:ABC transporter permease [Anaerolineae bacterium]